MGNHYHLMLRATEANLQRIMRHIMGCRQFFNRWERKEINCLYLVLTHCGDLSILKCNCVKEVI